MEKNNEFNIKEADLSSSLILEASAGTGKTYSLEHLFVRYILESRINIKEILAVTFTEKAASELKKRIKKLLRNKLAVADPESEEYRILKNALYEFSEVNIFTIHGFCRNSLAAFPVESGLPFDFRIMESDAVYRETVLDYFRSLDIKDDDEYFSYRSGKAGFDAAAGYFIDMLKNDRLSSGVSIYPDDAVMVQYRKMKDDFISQKGHICDALNNLRELSPDEDLAASVSRKMKLRIASKYFPMIIELFENLYDAETLYDFFSSDLSFHFGRIVKLTLSWLENNDKDISILDERETDLVSVLDSLFSLPDGFCFDEGKGVFPFHDIAASAFIRRTLKVLEKNLYLKKMKNSELDFNDLIKLTHTAVMNSSDKRGREFRDEIKRKYKVVLIDEFQDTDNLQWEIFSSLFSDRKIVLIGDPKQSIYRFRGADIEVYFKALEEIEKTSRRYMLGTNYRSEKRIVEALNRMFKGVFSHYSGGGHNVEFTPVKYLEDKKKLLNNGGVEFLAVENDSRSSAGEIKTAIEELFAFEIINLIESGAVNASDICILLESNDKCRDMYKTLVSLDIPAVYEGDIDLFTSDEMEILLDFLAAVSSPFERGSVIKTLISPLFDFQLSDIPLPDDDYAFEKLSSVFFRWKDLTDRGLFSVVIDEVRGKDHLFTSLSGNDKPPYLIRRISEIGGERKITNIDHIGEILINRNRSKRENSTELLAYLVSVMEGAEHEDEKLTRLERDDKSVRIMTVHKSKGLEFPVVFFGGGFTGEYLSSGSGDFYEYVENGKRYIDLIKRDENKAKNYYEQWEERKRLYYVAFTRAEQKLYLPLFRYTSFYYITSIYGSAVFNDLVSALAETGINPEIPFPRMSPPGGMKTEELKNTVTEKIYQLILEKFNDKDLFTVNREIFQTISEKGLHPLFGEKSELSSNLPGIGKTAPVFRPAEGDYKNKNISVVSYSSIVRSDEGHSREAFTSMLIGENSPGDEEYQTSGLNNSPETLILSEGGDHSDDEESTGEGPGSGEGDPEYKDILKGPAFGNLMHTLLEKSDYSKILALSSPEIMAGDEDIRGMAENISRQFLPHDKVSQSLPEIMEMLYKTIHGRFSLPGKNKTLLIGQIDKNTRCHELEFLLKIRGGREESLLNLPSLQLESGYIKGFIDLIFIYDNLFYIADWKTNYLGNGRKYYRGIKLEAAMAEHNYYLQMKLYMTALSRIISVRENIPLHEAAEKTGGCYYFFLRGLDKGEADSGVYFAPPDIDEIARFSKTFFEDVI